MSSPLENLEPRVLWRRFAELVRIPRPSQHEEQAVAHVKAWAEGHGFACARDKTGNLVVRVPATKGREKAPTVILQGHLDIVPEKDKGTQFDFLKDPIQAEIDGDWVVARSTTLGADNGIGVAAAMALAEDPSVVHGPLELLFTLDEETALTGASNLDGSLLAGRMLVNMDSEEDGALFVGCAGGCNTEISLPLARMDAPAGTTAVRVEVTGLRGGHSGLAIHENRGNSLKILGRVLTRWMEKAPVLVVELEGGNKHNAIPREAAAVVVIPTAFAADARAVAAAEAAEVLTEIGAIDPGLAVSVADAAAGRPADAGSSARLVRLLAALPHGVVAMSRDIVGLTETSTNLAVARTDGDRVLITTSSRSSVAAALRGVLDQVAASARLAGAEAAESSGYPGWQPNMSSKLLAMCRDIGREVFGREPKVTAIHAGLECGIIGEKLGGEVDMISFGPELVGVHAPGEKLNIPSVARFWKLAKGLITQLAA